MERGTDSEFGVLREHWAELDRERALADRLAHGATVLDVRDLLPLLSVPAEACARGGVVGAVRTAVAGPPVVEAIVVFLGAWRCWTVVDETRHRTLALAIP